jgi:hypothetical protein
MAQEKFNLKSFYNVHTLVIVYCHHPFVKTMRAFAQKIRLLLTYQLEPSQKVDVIGRAGV